MIKKIRVRFSLTIIIAVFVCIQLVLLQKVDAIGEFPTFSYLKDVLPSNLSYDPNGEFIFPTVIKASDHITNPLGTYYMYYAPHDAPGGICIAYSNNIEGPYIEYSGNPIVSKNWSPDYNVTHVSSPHVIWAPQYNKYLMYYHGENATNRWAYSSDGLNWSYGGVSLTANQFGQGYTECQYAKVFEYTIPGQNNRYIMLSMLLHGSGSGRRIALSVSNDGKSFTPYDSNLISPSGDGLTDIASPTLYKYNSKIYVLYHGAGGVYITEVGSDFKLENHRGLFHPAMSFIPDSGRAASPFLIKDGNTEYMFYESGDRLNATLALARVNDVKILKECENLPTTSNGAAQLDFTDSNCSMGAGNKLEADSINDYVEYTVNIPSSGVWDIQIISKFTGGSGKYKLYLPQADVFVGGEKNQYSSDSKYKVTYIGNYNFNSSGEKQFRLIVTGKDSKSSGYRLANDAIVLIKK